MAARRNRRGRRRNRGRFGALYKLLSAVLILAAIVLGCVVFFRVNTVEVVGDSPYTAEEIIAVSGVEQGDNLFGLNKYQISSRIYTQLPYIDTVTFVRRYPETLEIRVTAGVPAGWFESGGQCWLVDSRGKILESAHQDVGIVRTIGDPKLRFEEDPVRILRALKLVGQYSFVLEKETEKALHDCMPLIRHASPSRMTLELEKILKNPYGDRILPCFHKFGFLTYFLPFLEEHYNSPQLRYALDLLAKRNERLLAGKYRDSLSLVNAIFTLSFAEARLGKNPPGKLWENYPGIENDFKDLISEIFHPHIVTKRSTAAAIRSLLFQPRFKDPEAAQRFTGTHGYATARELAVIRNALDGTIPDFEGRCPLPDPANSGRRKSRRRGRRRRGKNKAQFISTASAPANGNAAGASQQNQ